MKAAMQVEYISLQHSQVLGYFIPKEVEVVCKNALVALLVDVTMTYLSSGQLH